MSRGASLAASSGAFSDALSLPEDHAGFEELLEALLEYLADDLVEEGGVGVGAGAVFDVQDALLEEVAERFGECGAVAGAVEEGEQGVFEQGDLGDVVAEAGDGVARGGLVARQRRGARALR